jgi:hypothetical protein
MDALHRGDDTELSEAGDVRSRQMLGVLDTPAQVALCGPRLECLLEDVERFAVRPIANRMDAQLVAVGECQPGALADV